MAKVSVIIAGRTERYFLRTVNSVLESATGDLEVVAVVDGDEAEPKVRSDDPRVKVVRLEKAIGQRAAYNLGVRESAGEYVMKIDAHALLSKGFDEDLQANCPDDAVIIPEMRRLDATKWKDKPRGKTHFMYFGLDCYCYYWRAYRKRPEAKGDVAEVLTGQGSCWFTSRKWNDHIGLLDEGVGSWGNVGIEVSLRTWLCGGTQLVNKRVWQAHWFRAKEGGFPYPMSGRKVAHAHRYTFNNYFFKDDAFEHQTRPFRWLIEKFAPVAQWEAYMADGYEAPRVIVYYTDSRLEEKLAVQVRKQIKKCAGPIPIISVSQKPLRNFGTNICVGEKPRGTFEAAYRSMYEQMLVGLEAAPADSVVYLCEHDVFYHPSHFAKLPEQKDKACFNTNRYHYALGMSSFLPGQGKTAQSQCVAYRELLLEHAEKRLKQWENGPGKLEIDFQNFASDRPNVDIRHGDNLTQDKGDRKRWLAGGVEGVVNLPGWGRPSHFESKVGYKAGHKSQQAKAPVDDAAGYLRKKWAKILPQPSPIRCRRWKRTDLAKLFADLGYKRGAEVGVKRGEYSETLCKAVEGLELSCVDIWDAYYEFGARGAAQYYRAAVKRLQPYNATLIKKPSVAAAQDVLDESLDFVYIDADHRFDFVMQDIIVWAPKVRIGGIISGHDYYRFRNAGVVDAVDAYTRAHDIREWWLTDEKEASFFWVR